MPEAKTGDAIAEILALNALGKCAGVLRRTMYVTDDLSDDLSVHCPIYPAAQGTLACVPLISGQSVGAVHLYWSRPHALPLAARASIARITEHADRITVSVGIATSPNDGSDRVSLLRIADEVLYRAKSAGRNRVVGMSHPPEERPKGIAVGGCRLTAGSDGLRFDPCDNVRGRS